MKNSINDRNYLILKRIKLHEDLERELIKMFKEQFGIGIDTVIDTTIEKYGNYLPDKPLDRIGNIDNINEWLQDKINITENRHAALLGNLIKKYKGDAVQLAKLVYEHHGIKYGKDAKKRYALKTAKDIYNVIDNYILDCMPCDYPKIITKEQDHFLEYKQETCLRSSYWKKIGIDSTILYDLRRTWTEAFVNSANPDFKYQVTIENIGGKEGFCHRIFKK